MALVASGVGLPPDLAQTLSQFGTSAYNNINNNYNAARSKAASDATAQGFSGPLDYTGQRFDATQGLDIGNLEAGMGAGLGNTAYEDTLAQRGYNQSRQLAEEAAALNKPSLLQQIFQGIGAIGKPVATYAGAGGRFGMGPSAGPDYSDAFQGV